MNKLATVSVLIPLSCCCTAPPAADSAPGPDGQPGVEQLLGGSLIPGREEERMLREHALAGELARTIERLEGVEEARVHLSLADRSLLSRDQEAEPAAAIVVWATTGAAPPPEQRLRELTAAVVPGLRPAAVQVFVSRADAPSPELVVVGPLEVAAASADRARVVLGALLATCLLLACGLIYAGARLRRLRR